MPHRFARAIVSDACRWRVQGSPDVSAHTGARIAQCSLLASRTHGALSSLVRRASQPSNYAFKPTAEGWSLCPTAIAGGGLIQVLGFQ